MGYTWYIPGIYRVKTSIGYPDVLILCEHLESCHPGQDRANSYGPVCTCTYRYVPVHVSTRILYWHVPCMYEYKIPVLVCTWYVLDNILQCKYVSVCTWQGQDNFFEAWCSHPVLKCYRVPSMAHNSISASSISKNTVFTGGSIYMFCTWYVQSTYQRCTCPYCDEHVPKTLHFQSISQRLATLTSLRCTLL